MDIRDLKNGSKTAAIYLAEHGIEVSQTRLLEALSRAFGERNWATMAAQLKNDNKSDNKQKLPKPTPEWGPAQGRMAEDLFARNGGMRCPFCGSKELDSSDVEADGPDVTDRTECESCGSYWTTCFSVVGYINAVQGERAPPSSSASTLSGRCQSILDGLSGDHCFVLTAISDSRDDWLGYVFRAKEALPVLVRYLEPGDEPATVEELLVLATRDADSAIERLFDAHVRAAITVAKFDEPSAREAATSMALCECRVLIDAVREDVVVDIADDVKQRASKHGFSHSGLAQATRLARETNETLDLEATDAEINEAARRLA